MKLIENSNGLYSSLNPNVMFSIVNPMVPIVNLMISLHFSQQKIMFSTVNTMILLNFS